MSVRWLRMALSGVLVSPLVIGGCCLSGGAPDPGKYFHRREPMDALLGFAYAVETGYWDYAFESLDSESREKAESPGRLRLGAWIEREPTTGRTIQELVAGAIRHRTAPQVEAPNVRSVDVAYSSEETEAFEPEILLRIFLVREEGEWFVDFLYTAYFNFRDVE